MDKVVSFIGMTIGGAIGWYAGNFVGFMTAFILSCVGTGVGLYVARRVVRQYFALAAAAFLLVAPRAQAQTQTPQTLAAAKELMQVMHVEKTMHDQIASAFDLQVQNNPAMAPMRPAMQQFLDKYLTWDAIGPQLTAIYAETFTESELKDLIAFYKSPTGQKVAAQSATLAAKAQGVGLQVIQAHQQELVDLIRQQSAKPQQPADTTHH
jgi:hypothetical protein